MVAFSEPQRPRMQDRYLAANFHHFHRDMRLSHSLTWPLKLWRKRKVRARRGTESAASRGAFLAGSQELGARHTGVRERGRRNLRPVRLDGHGDGHGGAASATRTMTARIGVAAMLSALVACSHHFRIDLRLVASAVRCSFGGQVLLRCYRCRMAFRLRLLGDSGRRTNHRGGNSRCHWHKHSEQEQKPKTDEFHATGGK